MKNLNKSNKPTRFVHNSFGILKEVSSVGAYITITNDKGETLKMSKKRYGKHADNVYLTAMGLKGKEVTVRTSQNTGNWAPTEWFSAITGS